MDFGCDLTIIEVYKLALEFIAVSGSTQCVNLVSDDFTLAFFKSNLLKSGTNEDLSVEILFIFILQLYLDKMIQADEAQISPISYIF